MPNYGDIQARVETVIAAVVSDLAITGMLVTTGQSKQELTIPHCIVHAEDSVDPLPALNALNNRDVSVSVVVESNADDSTLADHRSAVAQIFDAMVTVSTFNSKASALSEGVSFRRVWNWREEHGVDGNNFKDKLTLNIRCIAT